MIIPLFREGVTRSLTEIGGFEVVGEGSSAEDALRLAGRKLPDIVLLDISLPGGGSQRDRAPSSVIARRRRSSCSPSPKTARIWRPR